MRKSLIELALTFQKTEALVLLFERCYLDYVETEDPKENERAANTYYAITDYMESLSNCIDKICEEERTSR